jgi:hypothetical protein
MTLWFVLLHLQPIVSFDTARCALNGEGVWSIGMVTGPSILNLTTPIGQIGLKKTCLKNPIISCFDVTDIAAAFVADPFLFVEDNLASNPWYAFFEVKNMNPLKELNRRRGQIALSISHDQVDNLSLSPPLLEVPLPSLCLSLVLFLAGEKLEISTCCLCKSDPSFLSICLQTSK